MSRSFPVVFPDVEDFAEEMAEDKRLKRKVSKIKARIINI